MNARAPASDFAMTTRRYAAFNELQFEFDRRAFYSWFLNGKFCQVIGVDVADKIENVHFHFRLYS